MIPSRFSRAVVHGLIWTVQLIFVMFIRLRQRFLNLNFPGRLVLFASLALSACTGVSANRKVWSTPEIIDNAHSDGSPNTWQLSFDAQGNGIVVTDDINRVWANRYTAYSGWGTPELIDDMASPAEDASYGERFATRWHAQKTTTDYIDRYYNVKRRHSTLGMRSPQDYELANAA